MKKQVALAVAAALSLSVAGTALAAPANPFVDVPANHWAYDALASLQKDGVVTGYGDGTFRGDRNLTRYEMAAMVAKITNVDDKNAPLIKRLQSEFATELYNLGVRVDKLEKGASTIKFTGDARIRYQNGGNEKNDANRESRWQERVRINMSADVNDNIKFFGRAIAINQSNVRASDGTSGIANSGSMYFDRAEFAWKQGNWGVSAGRMLPNIGQGIMGWSDRVDGVIGSYNDGKFSALAAILDVPGAGFESKGAGASIPAAASSRNASLGQLGYQFADNFGMTATYANVNGDAYPISSWAVGANVQFAKDWDLRGEYINNTDSDVDKNDDGYFARLTYGTAKMSTPGSFAVYAEYLKFGQYSGAIAFNGSRFDTYQTPYNKKGWGLGVTYVLGKNHNMQVFYHDLKNDATGDKLRKQYTIATNFAF